MLLRTLLSVLMGKSAIYFWALASSMLDGDYVALDYATMSTDFCTTVYYAKQLYLGGQIPR